MQTQNQNKQRLLYVYSQTVAPSSNFPAITTDYMYIKFYLVYYMFTVVQNGSISYCSFVLR